MPNVCQRYSPLSILSCSTNANGSPKTRHAISKLTPCFFLFISSLSGSHSNSMLIHICYYKNEHTSNNFCGIFVPISQYWNKKAGPWIVFCPRTGFLDSVSVLPNHPGYFNGDSGSLTILSKPIQSKTYEKLSMMLPQK